MREFDMCNFCESRIDEYCRGGHWCENYGLFIPDVNKFFEKADELNISITDVITLIRADSE